MRRRGRRFLGWAGLLVAMLAGGGRAQEELRLPGTAPLMPPGDLAAEIVAGIDRFLDREVAASVSGRGQYWRRELSSPAAYEKSVEVNRQHLRRILGAVDPLLPERTLEFIADTKSPAKLAECPRYAVFAVRWPVFEGVFGEGLLLQPNGAIRAQVIAIPDADQTPEMLAGLAPGLAPENQIARQLAERGVQVVVPVLISREDTCSGIPGKSTNLPHREWIYRQAYEVGRHVIGYEVQKILALVSWWADATLSTGGSGSPIGLAGYGEGGLIALHAAALDPRVRATVVSGYFNRREQLWSEPIYRNMVSLLREFGDAEIASLVAPRSLIIEHSPHPRVEGPPAPGAGRRNIAAPGRITTPAFSSVEAELARARQLVGPELSGGFSLVSAAAGAPIGPFSERALDQLLAALGLGPSAPAPIAQSEGMGRAVSPIEVKERQRRQVKQLEQHTQRLVQACERKRDEIFWKPIQATSSAAWNEIAPRLRKQFWDDVIGRAPPASQPANPRSRRSSETAAFVSYEVVLDVWPEVAAWGLLQVPRDLRPGERRPVVVCQHGLEGLPEHCLTTDPQSRAFQAYKGFAAALAERGFITFAPFNPYRGLDAFRVLQRKANPLGQSLFSIIGAQHARLLDWLAELPFVDPERIAFYGLSYGGKSAMRLPAMLERYCLSICSGDFNEWVRKNAATDYPSSYLFTHEYEIFEWDLGHTYNYAEMAALIAPRPFMVERGHRDGVGTDEWVSYEYAKVRRFYTRLGLADRTAIEYFDGPHTINGRATFEFLHKHLNWPPRPSGSRE